MATKEKCRVCGKEYIPCRVHNPVPGSFRWQSVACSPECGSIYLASILASRQPKTEEADVFVDDTIVDVDDEDLDDYDDFEFDDEEDDE